MIIWQNSPAEWTSRPSQWPSWSPAFGCNDNRRLQSRWECVGVSSEETLSLQPIHCDRCETVFRMVVWNWEVESGCVYYLHSHFMEVISLGKGTMGDRFRCIKPTYPKMWFLLRFWSLYLENIGNLRIWASYQKTFFKIHYFWWWLHPRLWSLGWTVTFWDAMHHKYSFNKL